MKRVDTVYKSSNYNGIDPSAFEGVNGTFNTLGHSAASGLASTLGDLADDATKVSSALATFPYSSAMRLAGLTVMLYIGFKVVSKFVSIESNVKKALFRSR